MNGPDDSSPVAHARRASAFAERGEIDAAIDEATRALELEPQFSYAHLLLAKLLSESALRHLHEVRKPFDRYITGYTGSGTPIRVLQLGSARTVGLTSTDAILDPSLFESTTIIVQFWSPERALPEHDVIFNAIADPDSSDAALDVAGWLLASSKAPIINPPERVRLTGRLSNASRLARVPSVYAPATALFRRKDLLAEDAAHTLRERGFDFPLLLRSPGDHNGDHFVLVDKPTALEERIAALPGDELLVMEFVDIRGSDGRFRKYRTMVIGGELYPAHLAVSRYWNVHYFSAQMGDTERKEEQRFLRAMDAVLGQRAMAALRNIAEELGLDYAGIDFSLTPGGEVVVFEANAAMTIYLPDDLPEAAYRREAAFRIYAAAQRLIAGKAQIA